VNAIFQMWRDEEKLKTTEASRSLFFTQTQQNVLGE
jgi:hypothetical protein